MGLLSRGDASSWHLGWPIAPAAHRWQLRLEEAEVEVTCTYRDVSGEATAKVEHHEGGIMKTEMARIPDWARPHLTALIEVMETHRPAFKPATIEAERGAGPLAVMKVVGDGGVKPAPRDRGGSDAW